MLEDTELRGVYDTLCLSREGIYRWGFYLYRTTYDNQPLWERYISNLRQRAFDFIARDSSSKRDEMQTTFRISVIEDRESLDGASIQEVLTRFQSWANALPDESDESQDIPANDSRDYARFNLYLYVDAECLSSLETSIPFVKVVNAETPVPDSEEEYSDSDEDLTDSDDESEASEHDPEDDWMYLECESLCRYYDIMIYGAEWDRQSGLVKRPRKRPWDL
ncbi:hypothetical protein COL154_002916 [Colletotrichum chrysophilum]|uniref:uncharacterized protein n=1 Tax=Colletotrichum chrysophilum TaxID=1836956 RepID=UPI002300E5FC|nr:uncharacterized protein COL26b_004530 [Colletotrichum chrysophilum]KAJ0351636.1 hypothetical protein KNSL1_003269 [Colletotrichum chrysophilum]KAJ0367697.1 hypothetical protein COL154_002916 [Colletotrichum chrysophilum]KAJ0377339.1 hypothetical protein COL26b_004530 [Colletotrichum chrysophilum]